MINRRPFRISDGPCPVTGWKRLPQSAARRMVASTRARKSLGSTGLRM